MAADHGALGHCSWMLRIPNQEVHEIKPVELQSKVYMLMATLWCAFLLLLHLACLRTREKGGGENYRDKPAEIGPYSWRVKLKNNINNYTRQMLGALRERPSTKGRIQTMLIIQRGSPLGPAQPVGFVG